MESLLAFEDFADWHRDHYTPNLPNTQEEQPELQGDLIQNGKQA
ncbi:MAG: hypothetical protein ACI4MG_05330 [Aristaeellaceae bacterium]